MEIRLLGVSANSDNSGRGDGFEDGKDPNAPSAKDFDFSQDGGAWEEAKRYDSSLFDD